MNGRSRENVRGQKNVTNTLSTARKIPAGFIQEVGCEKGIEAVVCEACAILDQGREVKHGGQRHEERCPHPRPAVHSKEWKT